MRTIERGAATCGVFSTSSLVAFVFIITPLLRQQMPLGAFGLAGICERRAKCCGSVTKVLTIGPMQRETGQRGNRSCNPLALRNLRIVLLTGKAERPFANCRREQFDSKPFVVRHNC